MKTFHLIHIYKISIDWGKSDGILFNPKGWRKKFFCDTKSSQNKLQQ